MPSLLKISCSQEYETTGTSDVSKGASTLLRQHMEDRWSQENEICQEDRQIIKEHIVPSMTLCTDLTIIQNLEDCMYVIAQEDYPQNWPDVLTQIGEKMQCEDSQVLYPTLCALRAIIRKYQSKLGVERKPLIDFTVYAFEILENQFEKHLQIFNDTSILIMTVLTKIFFLANYVVLSFSFINFIL